MQTANNILLVRVPETKLDDLRALRDFVLESLVSVGLLVLPEDVTLEVMALPPLGGVEVSREQPEPKAPTGAIGLIDMSSCTGEDIEKTEPPPGGDHRRPEPGGEAGHSGAAAGIPAHPWAGLLD